MKRSKLATYISGGAFLLIILFSGYVYWFSPTHILFVNTPNAQVADITLNNDSRHIKITCKSDEYISNFKGYDAIVLFGRGLYLSEEQLSALEKRAKKGIPILTISSRGSICFKVDLQDCRTLWELRDENVGADRIGRAFFFADFDSEHDIKYLFQHLG